MPVIKNPGGRFIDLDNLAEYNYWLSQPGFSAATAEEENRYRTEKQAFRQKKYPPEQTRMYLATVSGVGKGDGYGMSAHHLIYELRQLGVGVDLHFDNQKIGMLYHNPYSIGRLETPWRVLFTMFESTKTPDDWKEFLKAADVIVVPSKWCADVFKKYNEVTPVVIPLGYNDDTFTFVQRKTANSERRDFVFLHYNAFNIRKGFKEVFNAFNKAFKPTDPVKLILKTSLDYVPLPITKSEYPNIEIIRGQVTEKEMFELNAKADCLVYPSRGEGFGLPPLEAMATGATAIVPNAHGISEYFDKKYMYEVKVKEECPAIYSRYKNMDVGKMVVCDEADLAKKMRWAFEHQEENIKLGKKASEYVKTYTYKQTAVKLKALLDELMAKPAPERRLTNILHLEQV